MYCTIQEAWPEYNTTSVNQNKNNFVENFSTNSVYDKESRPELVSIKPVSNIKHEEFSKNNVVVNKYSCDDFFDHLERCDECRKYIEERFKKNNYVELLNLNPQLKETLIVFLIGILLLMILNLFYK